MSTYLITGGAGFIGSNLARHVLDRGHDVTVLDNLATGRRENLDEIADRMTFIEGDIRNADDVARSLDGCAAVFHQAALGSVPRSIENPTASHDANVNGTLNVLETCKAAGVKRVVFAASSSVYGNTVESPKHEQMAPAPISPYAAGKIACEQYLRAYAASYGMETLCLRYFNVFGPRQDPAGAYAAVIPAWVSCLLRGEQPVVYGDGEQSRDFCYIDNVCEANWLAAHAPAEVCNGQALNIACNRRTSLNEILALLQELLGTTVEAVYKDKRPGDVKHSLAAIDAAREVIDYEPSVYFEEGLRKAIDWYRDNLG
ncbi:MAG: NAD-dependent epimerase/dehydratase family protein [Planctomycetes bacterium]|jgi:nucleoside-diphosphate-sugar epimerase|nr:SDR family oxidoreductase [Phycisphaerae bacterium]NBB95203.1 NAD-dependent epimerase/dehydratase family protein [Planctomycetota bacterium]